MVTGSGTSFIDRSIASGADLLITGDVKYHQAVEAREKGLSVIDMGHYHSELITVKIISEKLNELFGEDLDVHLSRKERDPFTVIGEKRK